MTRRSQAGRRAIADWCERRLDAWSEPHQVHRLPTSLGATSVVEAGAGPDTVVYLPGTDFNAATSTGVMTMVVGSGFRVLCADLPGQPGLSAPGRPRDEATAYAVWVREVLADARSRTPGRVILVGHSRGAAVALSAPPPLVDRLVLLSPAGLVAVRPTWPMLRATVPWLVGRTDAGSRRLLDLMAGPRGDYPADLVPWMTLLARCTRTTGAPGRSREDLMHAWRGRDARVLVGEHDCFFSPDRLRAPARADLGVEVQVVPSAGHLLVDQAPEALLPHLR